MSAALERPETAAETAEETHTLVTFTLADQLCGVPVQAVRDILAEQAITRIPLAPPEIAGSLNLRGRIVTAIDLRRRLNLPPTPAGLARMSVVAEQGAELYALLVDQVSGVQRLPAAALQTNPPTLTLDWAACSAGIHRLRGRLLVVLDVGSLLALAPPA